MPYTFVNLAGLFLFLNGKLPSYCPKYRPPFLSLLLLPLNDEECFVLLSIIFVEDLSLVFVIVISFGVDAFEPPLRAWDDAGHASVMTVRTATLLVMLRMRSLPEIGVAGTHRQKGRAKHDMLSPRPHGGHGVRGRSKNFLLGFSFRSFRASHSAFAFKKDKAPVIFEGSSIPLPWSD